MESPPNDPKKHHYIPKFYLSSWTSEEDGKLCEYSLPYDRLKPYRRHPSATGYVDRLYEFTGLSGPVAQILETKFFSPVDSAAASAMQAMLQHGNEVQWTSRLRTGWAQFLHCMLLRMPEDLELFKGAWQQMMLSDYDDYWEMQYAAVRTPEMPPTYRAYMASLPADQHDRAALKALVNMMASINVGQRIMDMVWYVVDTDPTDYPLLTSDRAVIRSNGIEAANGHIAMPIGPRKLFIAAKDRQVLGTILGSGRRVLLRESNRLVVRRAAKFVYGIDDAQLPFVKKHFGRDPEHRLLESTVAKIDEIKARIVDLDVETNGR